MGGGWDNRGFMDLILSLVTIKTLQTIIIVVPQPLNYIGLLLQERKIVLIVLYSLLTFHLIGLKTNSVSRLQFHLYKLSSLLENNIWFNLISTHRPAPVLAQFQGKKWNFETRTNKQDYTVVQRHKTETPRLPWIELHQLLS